MQFFCKNTVRRLLVQDHPAINGIDFLEVISTDQKTLELHFFDNLPGEPGGIPANPTLTKENIRISGGVRVKNINILSVSTNLKILTITVDTPGDFSTYTLKLVASAADENPPANFDSQLSVIDFSFKANCPSDFDCKTETVCPPVQQHTPRIDYLAKDFSSFRRLMLDRLSLLQPDWKERNIADLQIALVELLAYAGDHLSYYQDAVATEAYLYRARKRTSLRRHARLLDYTVHNGANARTWVHVAVEGGGNLDGGELPKDTQLVTKGNTPSVQISQQILQKEIQKNDVILFETKHPITLHAIHNEIKLYTWGNTDCCLSKGSTSAVLYDTSTLSLALVKTDVLVFEEIRSPTTGNTSDASMEHRHVVRLRSVTKEVDDLTGTPIVKINWYEEDALPFSLCLSATIDGIAYDDISIARGNMVLVDHGTTIKDQAVFPSIAPATGNYRPKLLHQGITVAAPYDHAIAKMQAATVAYRTSTAQAVPAIHLTDDTERWTAVNDLLGSSRFRNEFVPEIESDGTVQLRFGDDILGKRPGEGFQPIATYRVGSGQIGNVGPESIGRIVWNKGGILAVRNPLPAIGGKNLESNEEIRQYAPQAFRTQERAVTEADYVEKTELHPEVQKAVAVCRWTGSWHTIYIAIDRKDGLEITSDFKKEIINHLEKYRMAGFDLEIRPPLFVPLEIELHVCVKAGYYRSNVEATLLQKFSSSILPDGSKGLFHPDNFSFGDAIYTSHFHQLALSIDGVASIEIRTFKRRNRKANQEKENGKLQPALEEILRLDNDPNFPENGILTFTLSGGL